MSLEGFLLKPDYLAKLDIKPRVKAHAALSGSRINFAHTTLEQAVGMALILRLEGVRISNLYVTDSTKLVCVSTTN